MSATVCPGCDGPKSRRAKLCATCRRNAIDVGVRAVQAGLTEPIEQAAARPRRESSGPRNDRQASAIHGKAQALANLRGVSKAEVKREFYARTGAHFSREITSSDQMTWAEAHWCLDRLEEAIEAEEGSGPAD